MKNNLRLILYIVVAVLSLSLWTRWQEAQRPPSPASAAGSPSAGPTAPNLDPLTAAAGGGAADLIEVSTDKLWLWINRRGGHIVRVDLLTYPISLKDKTPLSLLKPDNPGQFMLQNGLMGEGAPGLSASFSSEKNKYELGDGDELTVPLRWEENGLKVEKQFIFTRGSFSFTLKQQVNNGSGKTQIIYPYARFLYGRPGGSAGLGQVASFTGGAISTPDDRYRKVSLDKMKERITTETEESGWVAMIQHYFLGAIVPPEGSKRVYFTSGQDDEHYIGTAGTSEEVADGGEASFSSTIYVGPKIQDDLKKLAENLDKTVDYGWLFLISQPMFYLLELIYGLLGNWGWSIVLMTLIIRLILFIPSAKAYKSMARMRLIAPELQQLKERYGEDRQAYAQAMSELFRRERVNPVSGCLPMLLQIPVFLAFYWMLSESVELRQSPWILWIKDLSTMDPYFVLPAINALLMHWQQKLNPPPTDPTQAKVMQYMPWFFGVMFLWFPSGLVLYWSVSNLFSIAQQRYMNKRYGEKKPELHRHKHKAANDG